MFRFKLVTTVLGDEVYFLGKILFFFTCCAHGNGSKIWGNGPKIWGNGSKIRGIRSI